MTDIAEKPATAICRTCLEPITHGTRVDPGYLERTGWYDQAHKDALVCFKAANYAHVPLTGRELAYYEAGFAAGQAQVQS